MSEPSCTRLTVARLAGEQAGERRLSQLGIGTPVLRPNVVGYAATATRQRMVNPMISASSGSASQFGGAPEPHGATTGRHYESFTRNEETASATEPFPRNHPFHR
jgi:hypothetical protein